MPKRKKFPRLPSGFGSIRYLGVGRNLPYAVHPPCTDRNEDGLYIRPKPICYVADWYTGFSVLTAWHAGTYKPGLEDTISQEVKVSVEADLDVFCRRLLRNMAIVTNSEPTGATFEEVYKKWYDWKYGEHAAKKLSESTARATRVAFTHLTALHDKPMESITLTELQDTINGIQLSTSAVSTVLTLIKQVYRFAVPRELCEKDLGAYVVMPSTPDQEHHEPFTDEELKVLWKHRQEPIPKRILIMCYSGFRVSAYRTIETNTAEWYFKGGVKTAAGKGRIVPIHSGIRQLVLDVNGDYYNRQCIEMFRKQMHVSLRSIGLRELTPHSCRHTFSRLCESYGVAEADRKRMMGHSFGADITNGVYGHRTLEELRVELEKIKVPVL